MRSTHRQQECHTHILFVTSSGFVHLQMFPSHANVFSRAMANTLFNLNFEFTRICQGKCQKYIRKLNAKLNIYETLFLNTINGR